MSKHIVKVRCPECGNGNAKLIRTKGIDDVPSVRVLYRIRNNFFTFYVAWIGEWSNPPDSRSGCEGIRRFESDSTH